MEPLIPCSFGGVGGKATYAPRPPTAVTNAPQLCFVECSRREAITSAAVGRHRGAHPQNRRWVMMPSLAAQHASGLGPPLNNPQGHRGLAANGTIMLQHTSDDIPLRQQRSSRTKTKTAVSCCRLLAVWWWVGS